MTSKRKTERMKAAKGKTVETAKIKEDKGKTTKTIAQIKIRIGKRAETMIPMVRKEDKMLRLPVRKMTLTAL